MKDNKPETYLQIKKTVSEKFATDGPESLLLDYARLFLGSTHFMAKPYGSVWPGGQETLMGDLTMADLELYREGGFDIDERLRELPDHIAAEPEFLHVLMDRENEARRNGKPESLEAKAALRSGRLCQPVAFGSI